MCSLIFKAVVCSLFFFYFFMTVSGYDTSDRCIREGNYRCANNRACVLRRLYCNRFNDCGDDSDEKFCDYYQKRYGIQTPYHFKPFRCTIGGYIPDYWVCDGIKDCADNSDETNCHETAVRKAATWLEKEGIRTNALNGGFVLPRVAVSLYLAKEDYFTSGSKEAQYITKELTIELLGLLLMRDENIVHGEKLRSSELAIFIHALLASCIDPRDVYDNDLVSILRDDVNANENYTNPFVLLALCNAGDTMTTTDVGKLTALIQSESHEPHSTDIQALALMALLCIDNQESGPTVKSTDLMNIVSNMRKLQRKDGSVHSLHTTGLVAQAIFAFNDNRKDLFLVNATKYITMNQQLDGSFKNLLNTYYVLPVLNFKSMLNISMSHCPEPSKNDSDYNQYNWDLKAKLKKRLSFSLVFGNDEDLRLTLEFQIEAGKSLLHAMETAASWDYKFKFEYSEYDSSVHVYSISGVQNDPENEKFWFLYKFNSTSGTLDLHSKSLTAITVQNNDKYVMWYRTPP